MILLLSSLFDPNLPQEICIVEVGLSVSAMHFGKVATDLRHALQLDWQRFRSRTLGSSTILAYATCLCGVGAV